MTVYLEQTTLKGAIKDASIKMNRLSKWFATKDSNVTIVGDVDVRRSTPRPESPSPPLPAKPERTSWQAAARWC